MRSFIFNLKSQKTYIKVIKSVQMDVKKSNKFIHIWGCDSSQRLS